MGKHIDIHVVCPLCRADANVAPSEVTAFRYADPGSSFYTYRCPLCLRRVLQPADRVVFGLLAGHVAFFDVVLEPAVPGPRIGFDDLIDLHTDLNADA